MAKDNPSLREAELLALLISGEKYGREIRDLYEKRIGRVMPLGSLYTTLDRMEDSGFVSCRMGDSTHERGGNRRKFYKLTGAGTSALNALRQTIGRVAGEAAHG